MMKYMLSQDGLDRVILPSPLSPLTGGLGQGLGRRARSPAAPAQPSLPQSSVSWPGTTLVT